MGSKKRPRSSSSSSDSNDEDTEKFRSAVDPDFKVVSKKDAGKDVMDCSEQTGPTAGSSCTSKSASTRTEWHSGHFVHPLRLTEESKDFVYKKLSEILESTFKEKERKVVEYQEDEDAGIRLFSGSPHVISARDLKEQQSSKPIKRVVQKIRKKKLDDSSESDEDDKIKAAAVSSDWVLNKNTV